MSIIQSGCFFGAQTDTSTAHKKDLENLSMEHVLGVGEKRFVAI